MRKNQWQEKCLERSFKGCAPVVNPGAFYFNVFLNDILHLMGCLQNCDLYNYADDNTACVCGKTPQEVCSRWEIVVASFLH